MNMHELSPRCCSFIFYSLVGQKELPAGGKMWLTALRIFPGGGYAGGHRFLSIKDNLIDGGSIKQRLVDIALHSWANSSSTTNGLSSG